MTPGADDSPKRVIRRIVVGLDGSPSSLEALSASAQLAALLEAELEGLFVEDTDLLSFAELPFASVTSAHFGATRRMPRAEVERSLRLQAQRAREAMFRAGAGAGVKWTFRVVRGNVHRELLGAAARADLLSLGCIGSSAARRRTGGSVAHQAARQAPGSVLILRQVRWSADAAVVALCDDGEPEGDVLEAAAQLARSSGRPLVVVLPHEERVREKYAARTREIVKPWAPSVRWLAPQAEGPRASLAEAVRAAHGGLLVLGADSPLVQQEQVGRLIDRGGCSLLIVRP